MKIIKKIKQNVIDEINDYALDALLEIADAVQSDLLDSQTIPFDTRNIRRKYLCK